MKKLLLFGLFVFLFSKAESTHIIGGNFVVTQNGANDYTIVCKVYRDCSPGNAGMPTSLSVGIYHKSDSSLQQTITMTSPVITSITVGDSCFTPTGVCIQEGVFTYTNVTIPDNTFGYYIQTELYARNNSIVNLSTPGSQGMTFYAEIPDPALANMNSGPDFGTYPSTGYFCVNTSRSFDFSSTDPDGDSLVYSLVAPLGSNLSSNGTSPAPYSDVIWQSPYNLTNIVGGIPAMSCDPITGIVTAAPDNVGTFVFALRMEEYRNSIKIGEVRRDIQFYSLNCDSCLINNVSENSAIINKVYPNPAESFINIENIKPNTIISILTIDGKVAYSEVVLNGTDNKNLNINNLLSGIYFITLNSGDDIKTLKLIKQ